MLIGYLPGKGLDTLLRRNNMLFITGLLALLALANAGGDHRIKGGVKGGDALHSGSAQVAQEASPYSFNIDTSASYGAKILREEVGDAEGRVKGSYSISGPRGTTRVVHYTADETGFHANVKTSEPNIETHSPANAQIEAVSKKGGSASVLIPIPADDASGSIATGVKSASGSTSRYAAPRDPIALPVANQPTITAVKTVKTVVSASGPQTVKTVERKVVSEKKVQPAKASPVRKANSDILPQHLGQQVGGAREVIVYDDGTIVDAGSVSGNAGTSSLQPLIGGISSGAVLRAGSELSGGAREVIVYEDGTIEEVGNLGQEAVKSTVSYSGDAAAVTVPKPKPELKIQRRPTATRIQTGSISPVVSAPKPKVSVQAVQNEGLSDNLKLINRQLIQRQNEDGILQTFGGIANSESDLTGIPVSLEQFGGYRTNRPVSPAIQLRKPITVEKQKPSVTSAANRGQTYKYTGTRVTSGILGQSAPRVIPGVNRVTQTQGYNNQYVVGNAAGSTGSSDDIKLINRQLIQRQDQEGVLQTFGGIANSESDLTGIPVSLEQFGGYGASRPVSPAIQLRKPTTVEKPKPSVTSAANRGQTYKYTGTRVTSGILGQSAPRVIPGVTRVTQTQGYNNQYVVGNAAGSIGSSDDIRLINRQLIQRQDQEGVLQTFGGIANSESDLTGIPVSLEQFGGYGASRPVSPAIQLRKPTTVEKPKPSVTSAANRGQTYKYTGTRVTSGILGQSAPRVIPGVNRVTQTQVYNNQYVVGNAAGSTGLSDDIKLINRQLIQRQDQEGVLQTFGGIANSESDLTGIPVSLEQFGGYGASRPVSPAIQMRKPTTVEKPKPSVTSAANIGQTYKYTGTRVTSGILGQSAPRVIPGVNRVTQTQGYNNQYVVGNAAGSIGSSDDIKLINRQLIQRQNQEGVLQTFGGIANSESDLTGLPVSLDQFGGYVGRPVAPSVQLKKTTTLTKPKQPKPSVTSTTNRGQSFKYTGKRVTSGILGPSAPRVITGPTRVIQGQGYNNQFAVGHTGSIDSSDEIKLINRQLIQRQNEEGVIQAFGGVVKSESDLTGLPVSLDQFRGYGGSQPIAPAQISSPVRSAEISKPKAPAQIVSPANDIISLNRNLIQKQNEHGVLHAFGGIVKSEDELDGIAVALDQIEGLSQISGYGVNNPQAPEAPKRPVNVAPKLRSSVASSQASRQPTATRVDQNAQGFGIRTSSVQRFSPARVSPQNTLTASRTSSDNQRTATRTSSDISSTTSRGNTAQVSSSGSSVQRGLSEDLININRQLIEKQNKEGIRQTFGGIIRTESDLEDGLVYVDELDDITKLVGYNTAGNQGPQLYGISSSSRQSNSPIEQSQIATGLIPADSPVIQTIRQDDSGQLQVAVDEIDQPSSLSQGKDSSNIPSIPTLIKETFKPVDLQENIPIEIQSYVPPMRPYNYRTQTRFSSSDSQNVQEQQKIEQIFV